jgi:DNA-binding LacI/PurR family transcriptional regulator
MKVKRSNIRDVARHAGVSIATVSRVLNGTGSFSPETIKTIESSVKELQYHHTVGSIVRSRSGLPTIALVVSDLDLIDPYAWEIIRGLYVETESHPCNINLQVFRGVSDDCMGLGHELRKTGVDGVIFIPGLMTAASALDELGPGFPLVFLDRNLPGRSEAAIMADNHDGAMQAARYLAKLGHTRMLYIGNPASLSTEREKREGFLAGLAAENLSLASGNLVEGGFERQNTKDALRERLAVDKDFSAIFVSSDLLAFGAKEALDQAGLLVPQDISLVGYGNIPFSAALGLTTVSVNAYDMGKDALRLLMDLLQGRSQQRRSISQAGLVIRSSCGRFSC